MSEVLIFATDDYLRGLLLDLRLPDFVAYELLKKMIDFKGAAIVKSILVADKDRAEGRGGKRIGRVVLNAFLKANEVEHNYAKRLYENYGFSTGIRIQFQGEQAESIPLIYRKLQEYISRNPLSVLMVTNNQAQIFQKYHKNFPGIIFKLIDQYYLAIFGKKDTYRLMNALSKRQYELRNEGVGDRFQLVYSYQQHFHAFLKQKGIKLYKCVITPNLIKFLGHQGIDTVVRRHLLSFIDKIDLQPYPIKQFSSKFDEYMFINYQAKGVEGLNIQYTTNPNTKQTSLCSINYLLDEDEVEHLIETAVERIRKNCLLIPAATKLCSQPAFLKLSLNGIQTHKNSLYRKVHIMNNSFKIVVRSFSSIYGNEGDVIFVVDDLQKCVQFREVLAENDISEDSIKDWVRGERGERCLRHLTTHSRYFDSATGWYINMISKNKDRVSNDLQEIFGERFKHSNTVRFIIPQNSQELIKLVFPNLILKLIKTTFFAESGIVKIVEFIASTYDEKLIKDTLLWCFHQLNTTLNLTIQTFSNVDLSLFAMQKMNVYKYTTVIFRRRDGKQSISQKRLTPISSFFAENECYKRGDKKHSYFVCYPSKRQNYTEFAINIHLEIIMTYNQCKQQYTQLSWQRADPRLLRVIDLVKTYCPNMDMITLYGDENKMLIEPILFYIQTKFGQLPSQMVQVEVDIKEQKIVLLKKSVFDLRYVWNERDRYLVQTHQKCVQEVNRIIQLSNGAK